MVFYFGMYSLEIVWGNDLFNVFFCSGLNCIILVLMLNICVYIIEIFVGVIWLVLYGEIEVVRVYGFLCFKMYCCIILFFVLCIVLFVYSNEVILMLYFIVLVFIVIVLDILKIVCDINVVIY